MGRFADPEHDTVLSPHVWGRRGFASSLPEEIHACILELIYILC